VGGLAHEVSFGLVGQGGVHLVGQRVDGGHDHARLVDQEGPGGQGLAGRLVLGQSGGEPGLA